MSWEHPSDKQQTEADFDAEYEARLEAAKHLGTMFGDYERGTEDDDPRPCGEDHPGRAHREPGDQRDLVRQDLLIQNFNRYVPNRGPISFGDAVLVAQALEQLALAVSDNAATDVLRQRKRKPADPGAIRPSSS